jgi:hypothetical protein
LAALTGFAQELQFKLPPDPLVSTTAHNLDFEFGDPGRVPVAWELVQISRVAGYSAEWRSEGCHGGKGCAVIIAGPRADEDVVGMLSQRLEAEDYRGKKMRLRAWVRIEEGDRGSRVRIGIMTDGEKEADFINRRGVSSAEWTQTEIEGKIPFRADEIHLTFSMTGKGKVWIDDVTFEPTASPSAK